MSLYNVEDGESSLQGCKDFIEFENNVAEEEENLCVGGSHRSISLDRRQDCDWSLDSIE